MRARDLTVLYLVIAAAIVSILLVFLFVSIAQAGVTPGTSWQWQLDTPVDTTTLDGVQNPKKLYDIDLFDNNVSVIKELQSKDIHVTCYFSAGSGENWRPDYNQFPAEALGRDLDGWAGEKWLDIRHPAVRDIMKARMDLAVAKGCDSIEPDNQDGYSNNTGFNLTYQNQIDYNVWLANEAHARGLEIALKNDVDQVADLVNYYDFAINEECNVWHECDVYSVFINQNKAVLGAEYRGDWTEAMFMSQVCPATNDANYDFILKRLDLTAYRVSCREGSDNGIPVI